MWVDMDSDLWAWYVYPKFALEGLFWVCIGIGFFIAECWHGKFPKLMKYLLNWDKLDLLGRGIVYFVLGCIALPVRRDTGGGIPAEDVRPLIFGFLLWAVGIVWMILFCFRLHVAPPLCGDPEAGTAGKAQSAAPPADGASI